MTSTPTTQLKNDEVSFAQFFAFFGLLSALVTTVISAVFLVSDVKALLEAGRVAGPNLGDSIAAGIANGLVGRMALYDLIGLTVGLVGLAITAWLSSGKSTAHPMR